jgi:intron-binding protein aquarius
MMIDRALSVTIRTQLLCFFIYAFQSLDCPLVRKECAPLVSIGIWHNLSTEQSREASLEQLPHLRKAWKAAHKRYDAADEQNKARLRFERSWLYTLLLDFLGLVYTQNSKAGMCIGRILCCLWHQLTTS